MKLYFLMISLFLIQISFGQKDYNENYKLTAEKIKSLSPEFLSLKITLTSKSKDTLNYMSMSCSWQDFYSTDNSNAFISKPNCDKNIPTFLSLAPNESKSVILRVNFKKNNLSKNIKIAFNIVETKNVNFDFHDPIAVNAQKIWSNDIELKE